MTKKLKKAKKDSKCSPRHRIHSVDKHYYSIWIDLELMAKLKIYAEKHECAVSDVVVGSMNKLVSKIRITKPYKEWMDSRRKIAEHRKA